MKYHNHTNISLIDFNWLHFEHVYRLYAYHIGNLNINYPSVHCSNGLQNFEYFSWISAQLALPLLNLGLLVVRLSRIIYEIYEVESIRINTSKNNSLRAKLRSLNLRLAVMAALEKIKTLAFILPLLSFVDESTNKSFEWSANKARYSLPTIGEIKYLIIKKNIDFVQSFFHFQMNTLRTWFSHCTKQYFSYMSIVFFIIITKFLMLINVHFFIC